MSLSSTCGLSPVDSWFVFAHFGIVFITRKMTVSKVQSYLFKDNGLCCVHRLKSPGNQPGQSWVRAEDGLMESSGVRVFKDTAGRRGLS